MKVLFFKAGVETFALDIKKIQKVVESPELYPIPLAPPFFMGAINFHNRIIPVLDMAAYLEISAQERDSRAIVLDLGQCSLGLAVGSIGKSSVLEEVQTLPSTQDSALSSVSRLVSSEDGKPIHILDPAHLKKSLESDMSSKSRNASYFSEAIPFISGCGSRQDLSEEAAMQSTSLAFSLSSKPGTSRQ